MNRTSAGGFNWRRLGKIAANVRRTPEIVRIMALSPDWMRLAAAYIGLRALSYPYEFRTRNGDLVTLEDVYDLITRMDRILSE